MKLWSGKFRFILALNIKPKKNIVNNVEQWKNLFFLLPGVSQVTVEIWDLREKIALPF